MLANCTDRAYCKLTFRSKCQFVLLITCDLSVKAVVHYARLKKMLQNVILQVAIYDCLQSADCACLYPSPQRWSSACNFTSFTWHAMTLGLHSVWHKITVMTWQFGCCGRCASKTSHIIRVRVVVITLHLQVLNQSTPGEPGELSFLPSFHCHTDT